jgi:hypothetical protein
VPNPNLPVLTVELIFVAPDQFWYQELIYFILLELNTIGWLVHYTLTYDFGYTVYILLP